MKVAPGIRWAVEQDGVMIFASTGSTRLTYPEAALWDLLTSGRSLDDCTRLFAIITSAPEHEARHTITQTLQNWANAGWCSN